MKTLAPSTLAADGRSSHPPWRASKSRRQFTRYGSGPGILAFLLPGFGAYIVLLFLPSLASILIALFEWNGLARNIRFVGLDNFVRLAGDPVITIAIGNGLRNIALAVFLQVPIGLLLGYVLSRRVRGGKAFLFFFFLPVILSEATLALMWRSIYQGEIGPLNGFLHAVGLDQLIQPWLSADGVVQWAVLIPGTWAWVGFNVVLFLTAINGVSQDLLDAAAVDGASPYQELRNVVVPGIRRVYVAATTLAIAGAVSPFLYPLILTKGGPLDMTQSFMTYAWQQIFPLRSGRPEWGYGSAIAVLHFGFAIILTGLVWRFGRRGLEVGE